MPRFCLKEDGKESGLHSATHYFLADSQHIHENSKNLVGKNITFSCHKIFPDETSMIRKTHMRINYIRFSACRTGGFLALNFKRSTTLWLSTKQS